jgi:hypothetical protein
VLHNGPVNGRAGAFGTTALARNDIVYTELPVSVLPSLMSRQMASATRPQYYAFAVSALSDEVINTEAAHATKNGLRLSDSAVCLSGLITTIIEALGDAV